MNVINNDLSLNTLKFIISDNEYLITGTRNGIDNAVYNAIDTIKNLNNGNYKDMRRADLKIMLKKYNAKVVI